MWNCLQKIIHAKDKMISMVQKFGDWVYRGGPMSILISIMVFLVWLSKYAGLADDSLYFAGFSMFSLWIGFLSYYLNKTKVNLELFDRRFAIYTNCMKALTIVRKDGNIEFPVAVELLMGENFHMVRFMFNAKIVNHIDNMYKKMIALDCVNKQLNSDGLEKQKREELSQNMSNLLIELYEQLNNLPSKFEHYLSFKHIH